MSYSQDHKSIKAMPFKKPNLSSDTIIGNYKVENTIGEGTFGKVKIGIHIPTQERVAVKILEKDKIQDKDDLDRISREIKFLKKLKHKNIIKIYEIIENSKNFFIIMEYASGGELFNYIVNKRRLDDMEASFFFVQIIHGLEYIHRNNVVHRDLKPENLLLNEYKQLKIIDFGLSNQYMMGQTLVTPCGSPCYAAPEMILGKKYSGLLVDIWSTGIIIYAMICGYLPFEDKNNDKLYKKILECKLEFPSYVSDKCKDLIKKLLTVNPSKRVRIDDIKSHPFFKQGELLIMKEIPNFDNEKYSDIIVEKLTDLLGNSREEIIYNIDHNRHNNITTSYELLLKRYKLNIGKKTNETGYQTTRNKTVDSIKEQTKNINININYVNKIGNININISDPENESNKKGTVKEEKASPPLPSPDKKIKENEHDAYRNEVLLTEPCVPTEYRKKGSKVEDINVLKKNSIRPNSNKMCISLDLENKDAASIIKSSRDKDSNFSKKYKEKYEEQKKGNSNSISSDKTEINKSNSITQDSTRSYTNNSPDVNFQGAKDKVIGKHKFSNSAVSQQKSPKKLHIVDREPKVKQMEIITEEFEQQAKNKENKDINPYIIKDSKEMNIEKDKIFKISTISSIKEKFANNPMNKITYSQINRTSILGASKDKEIAAVPSPTNANLNILSSMNENKKKIKSLSILDMKPEFSDNNIITTVKTKLNQGTPIESKEYGSSGVCITEPDHQIPSNFNSITNKPNFITPKSNDLILKQNQNLIKKEMKPKTQILSKNAINNIKNSNDMTIKKKTEVIEIVDNMVMTERDFEKPSTRNDKIGRIMSIELEPELKDSIYDTKFIISNNKDGASPKKANIRELTKETNKEFTKEFKKEFTKDKPIHTVPTEESSGTGSFKDNYKDAIIKTKDLKEFKDSKEGFYKEKDNTKPNYKILAKREFSKPRAKSPVINYNNITLKSRVKQLSSKDVNDKILKNVVNPECASKKITLDLNLKEPEGGLRYKTESDIKDDLKEKTRSNTANKGEPNSSRIPITTKVSLKDKETMRLLNSIKGKNISVNQMEFSSKDVNNLILFEKLQKACNQLSYNIKEISQSKYECSKENNIVGVEFCKNNTKGNKALKMSHVKGKELTTKEMIKKISSNTGI